MFNFIKKPFVWLKKQWNKFEAWVAKWAPGLKTKLASGAGLVGMLAASLQDYITGLPLDKFVTGTQIAIISAVLFTLSFWLRDIGKRTGVI